MLNSSGPHIVATPAIQLLCHSLDYNLCLVVRSLLSRRLPTDKEVFALSCLLCFPRASYTLQILVPFGDTVSQTNVLYFARINAVSVRMGGGVNYPLPDPPIPYAYGTLYIITMVRMAECVSYSCLSCTCFCSVLSSSPTWY